MLDSSNRFELISNVAKLILVIPHSNAGEERVFNLEQNPNSILFGSQWKFIVNYTSEIGK